MFLLIRQGVVVKIHQHLTTAGTSFGGLDPLLVPTCPDAYHSTLHIKHKRTNPKFSPGFCASRQGGCGLPQVHSRFSICHSVDGAPCAIPLAGLFPVPDGLSVTVLPAALGAEFPPLAGVGLGEPCGLGEVVQLRRGGSLGNFRGVSRLPDAGRNRTPGACR